MHINRMIVLQTMIAGFEALPDGFASLEGNGLTLAHVYGEPQDAIAISNKRLTNDEAEKIARLIVRLPELIELDLNEQDDAAC
jgi:hypothetical protein